MDGKKSFRLAETASFGPFRLTPRSRLLVRGEEPVTIGGRAFDILVALVERAGEVVSRRELIDQVWPGVIVDETSLRVHLAFLRKTLGDGSHGARYIANVSGRGYCFVAPIQRSEARQPSYEAAAYVRMLNTAQMPAPLARMVGRDDAVGALIGSLMDQRFINIVAAGGMGKTTVAVAVAHRVLLDFGNAVCFVDLGAITDKALVVSAVASAVGGIAQTNEPLPALLAALSDKRLLLVLDNCEHLIEAVAPLAERIFREAPRVHILSTSREPLGAQGENIYRLLPLESPMKEEELSASEALTASAVQLFMDRAAASGYAIELTDADAPTVAGICRRLDGIALAIELVASRVGAYGIRGTAELLGSRLGLSLGGRRTALPRHQTLRAMLDWSYNLLSPAEQTVVGRLSIFASPFTLDGAMAVGQHTAIADILTSLVNKSLIWRLNIDGSIHYRLLDTMQVYAAAQLEKSGELLEVAGRHASHYMELLGSASADLNPDGAQDTTALSPHLGNIRLALEWSFSKHGDVTVGVRLAARAAPMFLSLSLLAECERWCARALSLLPTSDLGNDTELSLLTASAISTMFSLGNGDRVRATIERALALAERLSAHRQQLQLLAGLSIFLSRTAAYREALMIAERIIPLAKQSDDRAALVMAEWMIGVSHHLMGNQESAAYHCERGVRYAARWKVERVIFFRFDHRARALVAFSRNLWLRGHTDRAVELARQMVDEAIGGARPVDVCSTLTYSIPVFIWSHHLDEAEFWIEQLVAHASRNSLTPYRTVGTALRSELSLIRGDMTTGFPQLRQALNTMRNDRHTILTSGFCRALAEGLAAFGQFEEAATTIAEGIELTERGGETFDFPNLLRAQAEILLAGPRPDAARAETLLVQSIEISSRQFALAWQLHAAIPLARLWAAQQRRDEASELLLRLRSKFWTAPASLYYAAKRAVLEDPLLFAPLKD